MCLSKLVFRLREKSIYGYGSTTDTKYFGPTSPMKKYTQQFFDINNADDLNERFLQFKNFVGYQIINEQKQLFSSLPSQPEELEARRKVIEDDTCGLNYAKWLLGFKTNNNNLYAQPDPENSLLGVSIYGPDTQAPDFTTMGQTFIQLVQDLEDGGYSEEQKENIIANSVYAKYNNLSRKYTNCANPNEDYLFKSLDNPNRTATRNGVAYTYNISWIPYMQTLLSPGNGHNINLFFYKTTPLLHYWIYAVAWSIISIGMMAGGCVIYNKYDVK